MRKSLEYAFWTSPAKFVLSRRSLAQHGQWSLLFPPLEIENISYSIWHKSYPIDQLQNTLTHKIVGMIRDELHKWLNPHNATPLTIHPRYRMAKDSETFQVSHPSFSDLRTESLRMVFSQVVNTAEHYARCFRATIPCYAKWGEQEDVQYPAPDLEMLLSRDSSQWSIRVDSFLAILRYPGPYDGNIEYMFERTIRPAIRLLFAQYCDPLRMQHPPVVIFESDDLTEDVLTEMASIAHPSLKRLCQTYRTQEPYPSHCLVYGSQSDGEEFCQVLLTRFCITYYDSMNDQDDLLIQRWKIITALCAVLRHTDLLGSILGPPAPATSNKSPVHRLSRNCAPPKRCLCHVAGDVRNLRSFWNGTLLVPSIWMNPGQFSAQAKARGQIQTDQSVHLAAELASMLLYRIQNHIKPLNDSILLENHRSLNYAGPDFLHPSYAPHISFSMGAYRLRDPEAGRARKPTPLPHYHRARDFLAMAPSSWSDITVYLADVFAGFYGYTVLWQPITRYSATAPSFSSNLCVVDFALAVRPAPPTTARTIYRSRSMPLTVSSPAVLLGVHSTYTDEDGGCLSSDELSCLSKVMEPHLRVLHLRQRHAGVVIPPDAPEMSDNPTLFCTYVKPGFVHLLAFSLADEEDAEVACYIVDSLPIALSCESDEDLLDRMRIVMALFTLQRQVIKICEAWSVICWPGDITEDEHEAIMEVTGICTPTWSVDLPPRDSEEWDMDFDFGLNIEDEPADSKRRVRDSCKHVSQWLAKVEPSDELVESYSQ